MKPLLRTTLVATRIKTVLYKKSPDEKFKSLEVKEPVFAVELPKLAEMYVGHRVIKSRITEAELTMDVKVVYPVSD